MLGQKQWREELQYDAITCMFAIHYFFESEKAIKTFLHNVSINLREGSLDTAQSLLYGWASNLRYCFALACLHALAFFHLDNTCVALVLCCRLTQMHAPLKNTCPLSCHLSCPQLC